MLEKIDVSPIIAEHIRTLQDFRTHRRSIADFVLFLGVPLAAAGLTTWRAFQLRAPALEGVLTAFSIFTGLLLSLLVMILGFAQSSTGDPGDRVLAVRRRLLRQLNANLSFAILLSVGAVVLALVGLSQTPDAAHAAPGWVAFLLVFFSASFLLNLLMILKRMYFLMGSELDRQKLKRTA